MKKDNGFTIPELLTVLVVMGILVTMATASYNGISKSIKERTLANKIELIKIKAASYAENNNINNATISVTKLILDGYLDAEYDTDKNEKISNPLGGYLDCYEIGIKREIDDYDVSVNESDNCDLATSETISSKIKIYVYELADDNDLNYQELGSNRDVKWTSKDVYLFLDPSTLPSTNNVKITWGDNSLTKSGNLTNAPSTDESFVNIYKVSTSLLYNFLINVKIEASDILYNQVVNVKIDKEKPTVKAVSDVKYDKSSKRIVFNGSDGAGSGLADVSYALMENASDTPVFTISEYKDVTRNQTYYAYAIDKVGNVSEAAPIEVTWIDNTKPVCKEPVDNPTWSQSYTYRYGCYSDTGTGCATPDKVETETEEKQYKQIEWQVEDNVGNVEVCSKNVAVNVDKTPPSCEIKVVSGNIGVNRECKTEKVYKGKVCKKVWFWEQCEDKYEDVETCTSEPTGWYNTDVKLKLITNDNLSGVSEYGISTSATPVYNGKRDATITSDTNSNGINYYGYVKDKAGNTNTCKINIKRDATPPSCSWSGESTTWTNSNRTISTSCNDTGSGCSSSASSKSWNYTSGTTRTASLSYDVKDNAGNTTTCRKTANVYVDKEGPSSVWVSNASGYNFSMFFVSDVEIKDNYTRNAEIIFKGPPPTGSGPTGLITANISVKGSDSGSGISYYEVTGSGLGSKRYNCSGDSDCYLGGFEKNTFKVVAVDKVGNRSDEYNYTIKCSIYVLWVRTGVVKCW